MFIYAAILTGCSYTAIVKWKYFILGVEWKKNKIPAIYGAYILLGQDLLNNVSKLHGMLDGDN